jgi:hypothetical protein
MKFITTSTNKKRQMVYLPAVNPRSFLFFFEKGSSGNSWSLRDYSGQGEPTPKYAGDFGLTAEDVRQKAKYVFDAPTVDTNDIVFWSEYTKMGNEQFLKEGARIRKNASEKKITEDDLKREPEIKRLLTNPNWRPAAEAAMRYLLEGVSCPITSWRKSSTWAQVEMVYGRLSHGRT